MVLTRDATDGSYQIFIDGSLDKAGTGGIGDIGNSFSSLGRIEDTGGSPEYFDGLLDEVLIFDEALSLSQVSAIHTNQLAGLNWDGTTRPDCVVGPDHYSISHGSNGVTCLSEQITITAHDNSHNPIDAGQSTITITTDSSLGDWVSIVSGGGSLSNGTANDGEATYTFASGSSEVVLEFSHTTTGTFGFNVTDGTVTETSGVATAADDPSLTIASAVLRFVDSGGNSLDIDTLISGKDNSDVYLRAIEADVVSPASCGSSVTGPQTVGFAATCENPSTCVSGQRFFINGTSINVLDSGSSLSYTVTVTDANGCDDTASFTIGEPTTLVIDVAGTLTEDADCNGALTGSIDLAVSGGTLPYTYAWSNSASTEDISNLAAGTYTVTVTDANGCEDTASFTIGEPTTLVIDVAGTLTEDADCNGALTGSIDLAVSGGTLPYTYAWSNSASTEDISNLAAGTYTVTVTDANGCEDTASFTIGEPTTLVIDVAGTLTEDADCNGALTGSIDLSVSGGTLPYTYAWSNSASTEDISNLAAGTTPVTVTPNTRPGFVTGPRASSSSSSRSSNAIQSGTSRSSESWRTGRCSLCTPTSH